MLSLKQLHYALAVEKHLHFKKAAEYCNISQSALSTGLSELESQLGLQIFERNNKKVLITHVGKAVLQRAKSIMLQVEDLTHLTDSQKAPLSFPIKVGLIPTIAPYLLPSLLQKLNKQHPQCILQVTEEQSHTLVEQVRNGDLDTAILALPFPCEGLLTLEFWQEDFYWVTAKDSQHVGLTEITSAQIPSQQLMLLKEGHCLKDHILDVCQLSKHIEQKETGQQGIGQNKIGQQQNFEATSLHTLIQMVQGSLGSTLIPAMAKQQLLGDNPKLSAIHLNEPSPHRRIAFIFRPNYSRFSSIQTLADLCREVLHHANGS